MAEEEYLNSQRKGGMVHLEWENNTQPERIALTEPPKVPPALMQINENITANQDPEKILQDEISEQNKKTIAKATSMLQEYHDDAHKQAVVQWNLKRRERKQLE